jgi:hypothetical protein
MIKFTVLSSRFRNYCRLAALRKERLAGPVTSLDHGKRRHNVRKARQGVGICAWKID